MTTIIAGEPVSVLREQRSAQNYANHRRVLPLYQLVAASILFANVVVRLVPLVRHPSIALAWDVVVAVGLAAGVVAARAATLVVQDRVIRFETRARLALALPPDMRPAIGELHTRQLIGLRFASDSELPDLVRRCLAGELRTTDDVKRAIRDWQADWLRA